MDGHEPGELQHHASVCGSEPTLAPVRVGAGRDLSIPGCRRPETALSGPEACRSRTHEDETEKLEITETLGLSAALPFEPLGGVRVDTCAGAVLEEPLADPDPDLEDSRRFVRVG